MENFKEILFDAKELVAYLNNKYLNKEEGLKTKIMANKFKILLLFNRDEILRFTLETLVDKNRL